MWLAHMAIYIPKTSTFLPNTTYLVILFLRERELEYRMFDPEL